MSTTKREGRPVDRATKAQPKGGSSGAKATVDCFVAELPAEQRALAQELRELVHAAVPGATESIKWKMPVFEHHGPLCYVAAHKEHLRFGLYKHGAELHDPEGLLVGTEKRCVTSRSAGPATSSRSSPSGSGRRLP